MDEQQKFDDGLHPVQPGLEAVPQTYANQTSAPQYHFPPGYPVATKHNMILYAEKLDNVYDSPAEEQVPTASQAPKKICGLRKITFILTVALILAVLVAVIVGGVAAGMKSKKSVDNPS
jgi:hypothetical protein